MSESAQVVTDESFQADVVEAKGLVLVDFWATWCVPCQSLAPKLDETLKALSGKFTLAKMDIETNPKTPATYGIRSIPTLILFKDGQQVDHLVGNHSQEHIQAFIEKYTS